MTTVVFDGRYLAVDSQSTKSMVTKGHCPKCSTSVTELHDHVDKIKLPAKSGVLFRGQKVRAWASTGPSVLISGIDTIINRNIDLDDAAAIVAAVRPGSCSCGSGTSMRTIIVTDQTAFTIDLSRRKVQVEEIIEFSAIGSGGDIAGRAIVWLGGDAIDAVAAAITVDEFSGGDIRYIDLSAKSPEVLVIQDAEARINKLLAKRLKKKVKKIL